MEERSHAYRTCLHRLTIRTNQLQALRERIGKRQSAAHGLRREERHLLRRSRARLRKFIDTLQTAGYQAHPRT